MANQQNGILAGTIDFSVFDDDYEYKGLAKVDMPPVNNQAFDVSGAGIAGKINIPVIGFTDAMQVTIEFIDNPPDAGKLSEQRVHNLTLRAAKEILNQTTGKLEVHSYKHILRVVPMTFGDGAIAPATPQGSKVECACWYREDYIDGKRTLLIDKPNNRFIDASGKDMLAEVNAALGRNVHTPRRQ